MTSSTFSPHPFRSRGHGIGPALDVASRAFPFSRQAMLSRRSVDESFVGVRFNGHVPREAQAFVVSIQECRITFPVAPISLVPIPEGQYSVFFYRSGAIKSGTLNVAAGELVILEFWFSRFGITLSRWGTPTIQSLDDVTRGERAAEP